MAAKAGSVDVDRVHQRRYEPRPVRCQGRADQAAARPHVQRRADALQPVAQLPGQIANQRVAAGGDADLDGEAGGLGSWGGTGLLTRLLEKLTADEPTLELYVHTVWALIRARPWIVESDPALTGALAAKVEALCDADEIPQQARRELDNVRYGLRLRRPAATMWTP